MITWKINEHLFKIQIRIPDDRTSRSNFGLIDDELEEQLRDILEKEEDKEEEEQTTSEVLEQALRLYRSCMDEDSIDAAGLEPLLKKLEEMGGWPVVEGDGWEEDKFSWWVE